MQKNKNIFHIFALFSRIYIIYISKKRMNISIYLKKFIFLIYAKK